MSAAVTTIRPALTHEDIDQLLKNMEDKLGQVLALLAALFEMRENELNELQAIRGSIDCDANDSQPSIIDVLEELVGAIEEAQVKIWACLDPAAAPLRLDAVCRARRVLAPVRP